MKTRALTTVGSLLVVLMAGLASPVHAAKYKINWLLAHNNLDYFREAADNFKNTVEKGSNGDIQVTFVTADRDSQFDIAGQPQTAPEIAAAVAQGKAEMGHSFTDVMGGLDRRFMAFDAPYLFRDYRHMEGVIEGPVGAEMLDGLRAQHMVGLALTYSGGASGVATMNREIRKPEDLKGLKVGVYGHAVNNAWLKSLGATPVMIEHRLGSIPAMARDGSLDAAVVTWRNYERSELYPALKHVNLMGSTYLVSVTFMNEKFYESLPEAYRALIKKASQETARIERAKTIQLNENGKRVVVGKGADAVYLSAANRSAFAQALLPAYKDSIDGLIGKDFIEKIRRTADGPALPSVPELGNDFATK